MNIKIWKFYRPVTIGKIGADFSLLDLVIFCCRVNRLSTYVAVKWLFSILLEMEIFNTSWNRKTIFKINIVIREIWQSISSVKLLIIIWWNENTKKSDFNSFFPQMWERFLVKLSDHLSPQKFWYFSFFLFDFCFFVFCFLIFDFRLYNWL